MLSGSPSFCRTSPARIDRLAFPPSQLDDGDMPRSSRPHRPSVRIRQERTTDHAAVDDVHRRAFADGGGDPIEVGLLAALRTSSAWIPRLSLVAEVDGRVCGHVVCTRGHIGDRSGGVGLGPLGVPPAHQRQGIGTALVHAVVAAAEARDVQAVLLLGSPDFYGPLGFVPAWQAGVAAPDPRWGDHFQCRQLSDTSLQGTFSYAAPFSDLPEAPVHAPKRSPAIIRPAQATDNAALAALDLASWTRESSPGERPDEQRDFFDRLRPEDHLVAVGPDSQLVGYVRMGHPTPLPASHHVMEIQGLGVHPNAHRQGIARALMESAIDIARERGNRKVSLRVMGGNDAAQQLYRGLGFFVQGHLQGEFMIEGEAVDDLMMARHLTTDI